MFTSVSPKGQATIPKKLRQKYGIKTGSKIEWSENLELGVITLVIEQEEEIDPEQAADELCGALKGSGLLEEYLKEKHEEIEREERKLKKFLTHHKK